MTKQELNAKVFEMYPKTEKERTCWQERQRLQALRDNYRKRLIEYEDKQEKIPGLTLKQDGLL